MTPSALMVPDSMSQYLAEIAKYPLLDRDAETALARRFRDEQDVAAAHQLVVSNLRFVVKVAREYAGYGLKLADLVQEGNVGLMIAVKKFDPDRGYRLISYAVWWIRATIQSFILRTFSMVKIATTRAQRRLFFKLRSTRNALERAARAQGDGSPTETEEVAQALNVDVSEVETMEMRLAAKDFSLDAPLDWTEGATYLDRVIIDDEPSRPEGEAIAREERHLLAAAVADTNHHLDDRERFLLDHRLLSDEPQTLQEVGDRFGLTRERARQIEKNLIGKLKAAFERRRDRRTAEAPAAR